MREGWVLLIEFRVQLTMRAYIDVPCGSRTVLRLGKVVPYGLFGVCLEYRYGDRRDSTYPNWKQTIQATCKSLLIKVCPT